MLVDGWVFPPAGRSAAVPIGGSFTARREETSIAGIKKRTPARHERLLRHGGGGVCSTRRRYKTGQLPVRLAWKFLEKAQLTKRKRHARSRTGWIECRSIV